MINLEYLARDYDEYFELLKTKAQELFPSWTDFNSSNIGVLFLELFAACGDQNSYYLNKQILETFLPTVRRRRNAIRILARMNYLMRNKVAASVSLRFQLTDGIHSEDVIVPEGYQVKTADQQFIFETVEELVIPAGDTFGDVSAKNWVSRTDDTISFDGSERQEKILQYSDYIDDTTKVFIEAVEWTEQPDLLNSLATDKHFRVEVDDQLRAVLIFGDGVRGAKPSGTGSADYKTGGGEGANSIQPGTITKLTDPILDAISNPVKVTVSNALAPSGGENAQSVDNARLQAPKDSRASERTVSTDDYEGNAESVPGVARALALGAFDDINVTLGQMLVLIVPTGGGSPSPELIDEVKYMFSDVRPTMSATQTVVIGAEYIDFVVSGQIVPKTGFAPAAVQAAAQAAVEDYFEYDNLDDRGNPVINFGFKKPIFYQSDLIDVIMNAKINGLKCVGSVTLDNPSGNIPVATREIPRLTDVSGLVVI